MSQLLIEFVAVILRWGIASLLAILVDRHVLSPHDGDYFGMEFAKHAALVAGSLGMLAWGLWAKYRSRIKFMTALEVPAGSTEHQVERRIANGAGAPLKS